ncbi:hypothetical protein [Haloechinothrix halophila]|uniref:hypothetical protein n=1 Tax=Haloechinothrix halophila TaxID=1069073 RepID=UPI00042601AD|nr:hypothetical protein [Haloechinothrix halophila]
MRHIWIRTFSDGLVRADQVIGITAHRTPSIVGKPSRWLLDLALAVPAGSGTTEGWDLADLHRTILQTDWEPRGASQSLAKLLHELSGTDKAGVIRTTVVDGEVRFQFASFDELDAHGDER